MGCILVNDGNLEEAMHKSKLAGFIIDCQTDDLGGALVGDGGADGTAFLRGARRVKIICRASHGVALSVAPLSQICPGFDSVYPRSNIAP
jgi:hypothetical protein